MEFTQVEIYLIRCALVAYQRSTQKEITKMESDIEGVKSGRLLFFDDTKKENFFADCTKCLQTRKEIINDITEFQTKLLGYGNR